MKFKLLSLSLFSISAVSPFLIPALTPAAMAGCVAVDTSVQVAVDRSRERSQTNEVSQNFDPNCQGGRVRSRASQMCNSDGKCEQYRRSEQNVSGDSSTRRSGGPNIGVKVHVPVHVTKPSVAR
ncbi:hypothetical protein [Mastigocladopsis repens]|uniref:hypothetical protein n=1 Tax=Mastigocladopsis repens TaxID=221287 RepID=UPI00037B9126|nr:hypothetical protein [Mastigocladopsis repens]